MSNYFNLWLWWFSHHCCNTGLALAVQGQVFLCTSLGITITDSRPMGDPRLKACSSHPHLRIFPAAFLGPRIIPIGMQMVEGEAEKTVKLERAGERGRC